MEAKRKRLNRQVVSDVNALQSKAGGIDVGSNFAIRKKGALAVQHLTKGVNLAAGRTSAGQT